MTQVDLNGLDVLSYYTLYLCKYNSGYISYLNTCIEFGGFNMSYSWLVFFFSQNFTVVDWSSKGVELANLLMKDLIHLNTSWSLLNGYPTRGQRTHSNANNSNRQNLILNFRLDQFFSNFGFRKRNIYPTLIICEYTNRLWLLNWIEEWLEAAVFSRKLINPNTRIIPFDPVSLAKNFTNGYTSVGTASNLGKSNNITNVATIGFPIYFSNYIYAKILPNEFPFTLLISDADRRKMGVKRNNNNR